MEKNIITEIFIVTTGGTIEKVYDEIEGTLENRQTVIKNKISSKLRLPYTHFTVQSILNKDSLYMDDNDRTLIVKSLKELLKKTLP